MFKSVFCLAFFGLFRIGELVCASKKTAQKGVLMIHDITFKQTSMKVCIRFSKTDQTGKATTIMIEGNSTAVLCPVQATKEYIQSRGQHAGPLYCHFNRTFLSRFQFNKVLQTSLKLAGSQQHIKSHSFRIGGATHAICKGIPYQTVQEMGRWKSDAAKKYIRVPVINMLVVS
jgi:site-specific recombinase XerD